MQAPFYLYAGAAAIAALAIFIVFRTLRKKKIGNHVNDHKVKHIYAVKAKETHLLLTEFLIEKKPYLQQRYSISQLANDLGIQQHHLSAFINSYYRLNFNDLINKYRIYHSKIMLMDNEWKFKTLQGIAVESGFGNRTSFCAAYKKVTGQNPSDFIKTLKENNGNNPCSMDRIKEACLAKYPEMKILMYSKKVS